MSEQRDKIEIIVSILNACSENDGLIKSHCDNCTNCTCTTNLDSQMAYQYLQGMISQGLVQREGNLYKVTEKGDDLRKNFDYMRKQLQLT
jgi:predicted transcriptional regulator